MPKLVLKRCPLCDQEFMGEPKQRCCSRTCMGRLKTIESPPNIRFWRHVRITDICWLWTGKRTTAITHYACVRSIFLSARHLIICWTRFAKDAVETAEEYLSRC